MSKKDNKVTNVWVNAEDLNNDPKFLESQKQEFIELEIAGNDHVEGPNRRDFLKYVGFGLGAAAVASCEIPVKRAIPYVVKPEEIVPGVANYYASTFVSGGDCLPVLVKVRDGRPIKIEGNPLSSMTANPERTVGGTCARSQASVLELYDTNRAKGPLAIQDGEGTAISWKDLDAAVKGSLNNGPILLISHTVVSPSFEQAIADFKAKYPNTQHIQYDPFSSSALLQANEKVFGQGVIPNYKFQNAKCIVSIDADFLGTWISPTEYSRDYVQNRVIKNGKEGAASTEMSTHIHFESRMSLTGSNADHRVMVSPSEQGMAVAKLYNAVASKIGGAQVSVPQGTFRWAKAEAAIESTAKKLVENKGKSLVVCGVNDVNVQILVAELNNLLESLGATMDFENYSRQRRGRDADIINAIGQMGSAGTVIIYGANPAHDLPAKASEFATALAGVSMSVSFNSSLDETSSLCKYLAPDNHYLESWGDANPKKGHYFLMQPTINRLFDTRAAGLSLLTWADSPYTTQDLDQPYFEYVRDYWKNNLFPLQLGQAGGYATFQGFWGASLHDGVFELADASAVVERSNVGLDTLSNDTTSPEVPSGGNFAAEAAGKLTAPLGAETLEVSLYETVNMGSGQYANNPWLQEMPDPIMRTTWDNFVSLPIAWDGKSGFNSDYGVEADGDTVKIVIGEEMTLPAIRQFGQLQGTVAVGLGYGRKKAGLAGDNVGKDLFPKVQVGADGNFKYYNKVDSIEKNGRDSLFACVQMHHSYGLTGKKEGQDEEIYVDEEALGFQGSLTGRSVFFEISAKTLEEEIKQADAETTKDKKGQITLEKKREKYQYLNSKGLYPDRKEVYGMGHHWKMAIDLNACTGCGACTVACMAENNVPVVGKYEVAIAHEMTWLRIDRYFYGDAENPNAVYQPMMCQHCDNAPCENVCPVAATNHSSEGLNQMTYNRCIGTRYCANNCPFKVRRFNWLDYTAADVFPANEVDMNRGKEDSEYYTYMTDNLTRMVLNPDVTVRSRGVIEKCSFCVQRIQEGKLAAKVDGRKLEEGDVTPACQSACVTGAIVFGDGNDATSEVVSREGSRRAYIPLEETNVRSSVTYLMKVTNKDEEFAV